MSDTTKTSRSPRYKHLRFFRLDIGERLDINLVSYRKAGVFSAQNSFTGALRRVMPWTKVRSRRLVTPKFETEKVVNEFCSTDQMPGWQKPWPENMGRTIEGGEEKPPSA